MLKHNNILSSQIQTSSSGLSLKAAQPISLNGWDMQFASDVIALSEKHQNQIASYALRGLQNFLTAEHTLATEKIGLPTAIARVDCTIGSDGNIFAYEVEERPSGLGVMTEIDKQVGDGRFGEDIRGHLENTFGRLPTVKVHPDRIKNGRPGDDEFLLGSGMVKPLIYDGDQIVVDRHPTLVRSEPEQVSLVSNIAELSAQSISTVVDKGRKEYRLAADDIYVANGVEDLPPKEQSFVIKSMQSSKTMGVEIWVSPADRATINMGKKIPAGAATWSKIERFISERPEGVLVEPFAPGIRTMYNGTMGTTAMRIFVKVYGDRTECSDGVYVYRPSLMIHGARDAVTGLVVSPKRAISHE